MPQIIHNPTTGAYAVVDDNNNLIPGAQVGLHQDSGQIFAFDKDMNQLAVYNPKTNHSISISDNSQTNIPTDNSQQPQDLSGQEVKLTDPNDPSTLDIPKGYQINRDIYAKTGKNILEKGLDPSAKKGFIQSVYEAGLKPLQDTAQNLLDDGDMGFHQAKLLATGLFSQVKDFASHLTNGDNDVEGLVKSVPILGGIVSKMQEQMNKGDYTGALGTLVGNVAPLATDQIGEGITNTKNSLAALPETVASKVLPKVFPRSSEVLPADTAAAATSGDLQRSTGQITGNSTASKLEQTHGGKVAADLADQQRAATSAKLDDLKKQFVPNGIPDNVNGILQKKLAENYFDAENAKNQQYSDFQTNHVEKNTIPVVTEKANPNYTPPGPVPTNAADWTAYKQAQATNTPTIQQIEHLQGPVFLHETLPLATDLKTKLDNFKAGSEYQSLPELAKQQFNNISSTVNNLVQPTKTIFQGKEVDLPVADYEKVKLLRSAIGKKLGNISQFGLPDKMLSDIKTSLGNDLQNSVKNYWGNGQQASSDLADANASHAALRQLFNPDLKGKIFSGNSNLSKSGANMADPTSLIDDVGKSPVIAKQFMDGLGPQNAQLAKGAVLGKLIEGATNTANNAFSADSVINQLEAPGYRELFSASDRANIINTMRQFRTMNPGDLNSKVGYIQNMAFHMALPAAGALAGNLSGHMITGALAGGMLEVGLGQFARRILLDPKYARIAAQLPYAKAGSAQAGLLQTQLMQALKGTTVGVVLNNGQKVPAQVDNNGKLQVSQ